MNKLVMLVLIIAIFCLPASSQINFTEHIITSGFNGACYVFAIDLDSDGDMDVLGAAEYANSLAWWENDGAQNFTEHTIIDNYDFARTVKAADVDSDGDIDVLGAATDANDISWWENDGNENFTRHILNANFEEAKFVHAADVDSDGDMDILGAAYYSDITWWENDGSQNFTEHTVDGDFNGAISVYTIDVDQDGDVDILGTAHLDDDVTWWENDGNQIFTKHTIDRNFDGAHSVYAVDVDNDGDIDVLGAAFFADDIAWWENDGDQNFTEHTLDGSFDGAESVFAADLDYDGDMDVLGAAILADDITWWENDGYQSFTDHTIDGGFNGAHSVFAADIDGDGDLDVLGAANETDEITWWENDLDLVRLSTSDLSFPQTAMGETSDLPLSITNIGTQDIVALSIMSSQYTDIFTTNWDEADSLIASGDSLNIEVVFTPTDSAYYQDSLIIVTDSDIYSVSLTGLADGVLAGTVNGTIGPGTFYVADYISVANGDSLIIQPGTALLFEGEFAFDINGYLSAVGTEQDSIKFMPADTSISWGGIDFNDSADDASIIEFCLITGSNSSGIIINCSSPSISQSLITGNSANQGGAFEWGGGGIHLYGLYNPTSCAPVISDCIITENSTSRDGGGIYAYMSSGATFQNCTISRNSKTSGQYWGGGGVYAYGYDTLFENCIIIDNECSLRGGGINAMGSSAVFTDCIVSGNYAVMNYGGCAGGSYYNCVITENTSGDMGGGCGSRYFMNCTISGNTAVNGGGVYGFYTGGYYERCMITGNEATSNGGGGYYGTFSNCIITENIAGGNGGGVLVSHNSYSNTAIFNSIINDNFGNGGIYYTNPTNYTMEFNNVFNNENGNIIGDLPAGIGSTLSINANGDSCDVNYNIFEDPLFYSITGDSAFYLTENSPCIDAGNPASALDPDSTVCDIGKYYFPQTGPFIPQITLSSDSMIFPETLTGYTDTLQFTIHNTGNGFLLIDEISLNQGTAFTWQACSTGTTIAPGFGFDYNVVFTPPDSIIYTDILTIENNDVTMQIYLAGTGIMPVIVTLTPENPPIQIPANGGTFDFNLAVENSGSITYAMDIWTNVKEPNGNYRGPLLNYEGTIINPGQIMDINRNQAVGREASSGVYSYYAYAGDQPNNYIACIDSFEVEKLSTSDGGPVVIGWDNWGEEFDESNSIIEILPEEYCLHSAFPNPFNPETTIAFDLPTTGNVELFIFNLNGQEVARLIDGWQQAGTHEIKWNASDMPSGIYFARITAKDFAQTKKLLLVK